MNTDYRSFEKNKAKQKYLSARINMLLMIVFTVVNIFLLIGQTGRSFLFSAFIPQVVLEFGIIFGGRAPAEQYAEYKEMYGEELNTISRLFTAALIVAVVIVLVYLLCFFMSKYKPGFMTAALVLFGIDICAELYFIITTGFDTSTLIDLAIHVWVLYYMIVGVKYAKAAFSPDADPIQPEVPQSEAEQEETISDETSKDDGEKTE